jgi:hypothetical protein
MADKKTAERAYYLLERRGRPFGSPDTDWFRAVEDERQELRCRGLAVP